MPDGDAADAAAPSEDDQYARLIEKHSRVSHLEGVRNLLEWDERATMPEGGREGRAQQQRTISAILQEHRSDREFADLLEALDPETLPAPRAANVREIRRTFERHAARPAALPGRLSDARSEAIAAWEVAREQDAFERFQPHLERIVALKREEAAAIDPDEEPYAVLVDEYAPYTDIDRIDRIFDRIRAELVPLLEDVRNADVELHRGAFAGTFDVDAQVSAYEALLDALGFDRSRGRTETVANAVTIGDQYDCRIGLWPIDDQLRIGVTSTVHEFGHALYLQQLPREHYGTPLGADRGTYVQESQAAFWEGHIASLEAFWEFAQPILTEHMPALEPSPRELHESYVRFQPGEPNALLADKMSFPLHTLVRYEIEKGLFSGELTVAEIPDVWGDRYEEYLGFRPGTASEGPLLTIHWANGDFGYFPTYVLGEVLAAQFAATAREAIDEFEAHVRRGEFEPIRRWLGEEIHRHGQRYPTQTLIRRVTGSGLTADAFLETVTERYSRLYGL